MTGLSDDLLDRVLGRLGFSVRPDPDLASLEKLYASWCLHVPFDNIRKMIVLRSAEKRTLPGMDAAEFFENWLTNGSGATCWPIANALFMLLSSLGYRAFHLAGSMRDMGINHGSVKISVDGMDYIADASLMLNMLVPLDHRPYIGNDPVFPVEWERDGASHLLWLLTPPGSEFYYCRMTADPVDISFFEERYEATRERSIFNQRLYARRNYPGELILLWGNTRFSRTVSGLERRDLSRDDLCHALRSDIGISDVLIHEWAAAGGLEASFEPSSAPSAAPITLKPPSQRQGSL